MCLRAQFMSTEPNDEGKAKTDVFIIEGQEETLRLFFSKGHNVKPVAIEFPVKIIMKNESEQLFIPLIKHCSSSSSFQLGMRSENDNINYDFDRSLSVQNFIKRIDLSCNPECLGQRSSERSVVDLLNWILQDTYVPLHTQKTGEFLTEPVREALFVSAGDHRVGQLWHLTFSTVAVSRAMFYLGHEVYVLVTDTKLIFLSRDGFNAVMENSLSLGFTWVPAELDPLTDTGCKNLQTFRQSYKYPSNQKGENSFTVVGTMIISLVFITALYVNLHGITHHKLLEK